MGVNDFVGVAVAVEVGVKEGIELGVDVWVWTAGGSTVIARVGNCATAGVDEGGTVGVGSTLDKRHANEPASNKPVMAKRIRVNGFIWVTPKKIIH